MLGNLLANATNDVTSQDLHDRALMYHRLLQAGPAIAENIVCGASPKIPTNKVSDILANGYITT